MSVFKRDSNFVANIIYKEAVDEEKEWRKKKENEHDKVIVDKLLKEICELGYSYKYFVDITNRNNHDEKLFNIILGYIGKFQDEEISAKLVEVIGKKGNISATETILNNYFVLSNENKRKQAIFYDNALSKIMDKRFLSTYIELLKVPEDAIKLPLTMIMLGKWKSKEAKPYFFKYLNSKLLYLNKHTSDLIFISLEALSYYHDPDGIIMKEFENKLNSNDHDLLIATKKAIKRLKKRKM